MAVDFGQSILASSIALGGLLVIMAVVYFIWSRIGLKKKQKYFKELHVELAPGDKVEVKVRSGAVLDVSRYAIQQIAQ